MRIALIFFIAVPLAEMLLLFEVADRVGAWTTLGLVVLTAVIGIQILKFQGLSTLLRARQRLQTGELPAQEIVEGMLLAGAGALLLTPGFITDTLGFVCLTGPLRRPIARRIIGLGVVRQFDASSGHWSSGGYGARGGGEGATYEGEYNRDEEGLKPPGRSD